MPNRLTAPNQVDATAERRYERPRVRWADMCRLLIASGVALLLVMPAGARAPQAPGIPSTQQSLGGLIASLSEPGGYFDTDNLISNERWYLHVVPALRALAGKAGDNGVYLGVGPDQNFSYIAHLRPTLAILIDIRRDNLLLHLLFKALFSEATTRAEYLALLTGRSQSAAPRDASIESVVRLVDEARPLARSELARLQARLAESSTASACRFRMGTAPRLHASICASSMPVSPCSSTPPADRRSTTIRRFETCCSRSIAPPCGGVSWRPSRTSSL